MTHRRRPSAVTMPPVSENSSPPEHSGPFSPIPPFQCLQSLGAHLVNDEPPVYEEVMRRQNMQDFQYGPTSSGQRVSFIVVRILPIVANVIVIMFYSHILKFLLRIVNLKI